MNNPPNSQNPHAGHRQRMRERLFSDPLLTGFTEHEVLEMLLYYCIPRVDTNGTAHSLIYYFGSLDAVMTASPEEMVQSGLIGREAAASLAFFGSVCGYLRRGFVRRPVTVDSVRNIKNHIHGLFYGEKREVFLICGVNPRKELVSNRIVGIGDDREMFYNPDTLLRAILSFGFKSIILAHNHPFSPPTPSHQDIDTTRRLMILLRDMDIEVIDHLISGIDGVFSFREYGMIHDIFHN